VTIRYTVNDAAVRALLTGPRGPVVAAMTAMTRDVEAQAKARAPVDTGNLRSSITSAVTVTPGAVTGTVVAPVEYAAAVHDGRAAQTIRPVRARALRFRVGNRVVFAMSARVPATRGRPFLSDALTAVAPRYGFDVHIRTT
jgi:hypothetical protein